MRHRIGIVLAIVMAGVLFFAGSWGYLRLLRLPAPAEDYVSSLARTTESQEPAGSADTIQPVRLSLTAGTLPGTPPWSSLDRPRPPGSPTELGGLFVREQCALACCALPGSGGRL